MGRGRGVGWQGIYDARETTRALARQEEQRRQRATAQLNRVCSVFARKVKRVVDENGRVHTGLPSDSSGQLPFLG
jgi:hypothetical protein